MKTSVVKVRGMLLVLSVNEMEKRISTVPVNPHSDKNAAV